MTDTDLSPDQYVKENQEVLSNIIKHSSDDFVRSLAVAAIVEYGDDATRGEIIGELEKLKNCETNQQGEN